MLISQEKDCRGKGELHLLVGSFAQRCYEDRATTPCKVRTEMRPMLLRGSRRQRLTRTSQVINMAHTIPILQKEPFFFPASPSENIIKDIFKSHREITILCLYTCVCPQVCLCIYSLKECYTPWGDNVHSRSHRLSHKNSSARREKLPLELLVRAFKKDS